MTLPERLFLKDKRGDLSGGQFGLNEIVPPNGAGFDIDATDSWAILLMWNFDVDTFTISCYHIQVSIDGGKYEFLGPTYSGNIICIQWTPI